MQLNPEKKVLEKIHNFSDSESRTRLLKVFYLAKSNLQQFLRRTGESYFQHVCEVALTVAEVMDDPATMAVALLHDIQIHPDGESFLNDAGFMSDECNLVKEMHQLRRLDIDQNTKDLDTVLQAFSNDPRLLPLRMAHRLNDVRHFDRFDVLIKKRLAEETLHMYTSIAGRLGLNAWRYEMEDASFKIIYPDVARRLFKKFQTYEKLDKLCLSQTQKFFEVKFRAVKIDVQFETRIKNLYSTYRKMLLKHRKFEELTDRLALRLIVQSEEDCYRALGIVHRMMHPIPGKLKDYIGAPKENGYRSLHTVVYPLPGVTEQAMEIQIRTPVMHDECEFGLAKHATYKDLKYALSSNSARVNLFSNLEILRQETSTPLQFEKAMRSYFSEDRLVVFDEKNNLYHLKKPANALDFACLVYGKKCMRLKGVRINGRYQEIDTKLRDGDTVEALFSRNILVAPSWLDACYHRSSRKILREAFVKQKEKISL